MTAAAIAAPGGSGAEAEAAGETMAASITVEVLLPAGFVAVRVTV